jgi:hypothetical protein
MEYQVGIRLKINTSVTWVLQRLKEELNNLLGEGNYGVQIYTHSKKGEVTFSSYDPVRAILISRKISSISPHISVEGFQRA